MKKLSYLLILAVALCACSRESDLKKSIFVPDPDDNRLPAYSEWGYNTFGAYIDREVFIYNDDIAPFRVVANGTATEFLLIGGMYDDYHTTNDKVSIIIRSTSIHPQASVDLLDLNGKEYKLGSSDFQVFIERNGMRTSITGVSGTITFQRVQKVLIDKKYTEMILSGYFDLSGKENGTFVSISDGRFDVGVKDNYNFVYQL